MKINCIVMICRKITVEPFSSEYRVEFVVQHVAQCRWRQVDTLFLD